MMNWKIASILTVVIILAIIIPQMYCMYNAKKHIRVFTPITRPVENTVQVENTVPVENTVQVENKDTFIQEQTNKQLTTYINDYNNGHAYSDSIKLDGKIESLIYEP